MAEGAVPAAGQDHRAEGATPSGPGWPAPGPFPARTSAPEARTPIGLPAADLATVAPALHPDEVPLTEAQLGLWIAQRLDPANPIFNTGHLVSLIGPLDHDAFREAVTQAVAEAEALSLRFRDTPAGPVQHTDPAHRPQLGTVDLRDHADFAPGDSVGDNPGDGPGNIQDGTRSGASGAKAAARRAVARDMSRPVNLERDLLAAQTLFCLPPDADGRPRHLWYGRIHHLAGDAFAHDLLARRVARLYAARVVGTEAGTPLSPFAAAVEADRRYRADERRLRDAEHWRTLFRDAPAVAALSERTARPVSAHRHHRATRLLDQAATERLARAAAHWGATWPDLALAVLGAYLRRCTGAAEAALGVSFMNRLGSGAARTVATLVNVLPVRVQPDEDAPIATLVADTVRQMTRARRHGRYREEQLRRDLGRVGTDRRLYGVLVNLLPFEEPLRFHGLDVSLEILGTGPVDDLTVTLRGGAAGTPLRLDLDSNPALYSEDETAAHADRFLHFLGAAVDAAEAEMRAGKGAAAVSCSGEPDALPPPAIIPFPLSALSLATPAEAAAQLNRYEPRALPPVTLWDLLRHAFQATPGAIAVTLGAEALTFRDLDRRSAALAEALRARGVGRDDLVAVMLDRSPDLVVALVAVLRAGAAYLPLDPEHPRERTARILGTARPPVALAAARDAALLGDVPLFPPEAWPLRPRGEAAAAASAPLPAGPSTSVMASPTAPVPGDAAYAIFTSGSTGEPKGVVVEHRAIVNRLLWMRDHYGITAADRVLQKTPATFDVSVWEFFLPLISGATLVLAPPGAHRDPAAMAAIIRDAAITACHFVPSMLTAFLREPAARSLRIPRVFCSGEELPADLRDRFHDTVSGALHNLYGPTEAAVDVSYWPALSDDRSRPVPIGWPVWNTRLLVLDDALRPLPPGVAGHLFLGGVQLARGYLHRPDLTAERFIPSPFHADERLYRTGDLARLRPDGAVVFLGRSDHQVKIRGLRIELGEIEAALARLPAIRHATVLAREDRAGDQRLVAYVVPADRTHHTLPDGTDLALSGDANHVLPHQHDHVLPDDADHAPDRLRAALAATLPDYMIPQSFVVLDHLPVTANGKLDRAALPAPAAATAPARAPANEAEHCLVTLFAEVLEQPAGPDDDFFGLGGHSLLAVDLLLRIRERWNRDPGLGALFEHPTPARLAALLGDPPGALPGLPDAIPPAGGGRAQPGPSETVDGGRPAAVPGPSPASDTINDGLGPILHLGRGDPARAPLFVIHPAGGIGWCYAPLARALAPHRATVAIQAPALHPDAALPESLDALAADYAARLLAIRPDGPFHLLGWSVGGIIAQAVALQLRSLGHRTGVVAMLDSYPADLWRDQPDTGPGAALGALMAIAGHPPEHHPEVPLRRDAVLDFLRRSGSALGQLPPAALDGVARVVEMNNRLVRTHHHRRYDGTLLHLRAALDHADRPELVPDRWRPYAAALEVADVPAYHGSLCGPEATAVIAPILRQRLDALDGAAG